MSSAGSSPRTPSPVAESTIHRLREQLTFHRRLSSTLQSYLHGWERLCQVWREDSARFRHQGAEIQRLQHDLALVRRENQRLRQDNERLHEQRELQYPRNPDAWGTGRIQQATERHLEGCSNSRVSARTFLDHMVVEVRRINPLDESSDSMYEDEDDSEEADEEELMPRLQENVVDTSEGYFDQEGDEYDGDTMAGEDSGYESATAVSSSDEYEDGIPGSQMVNHAEHHRHTSEGVRSQRSGSESSESGSSDAAVWIDTMGDEVFRMLTRFAIRAFHRVRLMTHRNPRA